MKTLFSRVLATAGTMALLLSPVVSHAATTSVFGSGDLIKGSGPAVYYFGPDGRRYVFPNDKTYFTWYSDFSKVKTVSDGVLSTIPLGRSNVTYRPGRKMIKITTDPKVYAVDQGGFLRGIGSEQLAETLYGLNWKKNIDDVADGFFVNYKMGTPIQTASDYQPTNVMTQTATISQDKQFDETKITVTIGSTSNGFVPSTTTVKKGTTITWTNNDNMVHTVKGNGWASGDIKPMGTYSRTFDTAGAFDYTCSIHPVMQGSINVVN